MSAVEFGYVPGEAVLLINQGADFDETIILKNPDPPNGDGAAWVLTGYDARLWINLASIPQANPPVISATKTNGRIQKADGGTFGSSHTDGSVRIVIPASVTATLSPGTPYVWDLEVISGGGFVTRPFGGTAEVTQEITVGTT